jgi:hypothetical protein
LTPHEALLPLFQCSTIFGVTFILSFAYKKNKAVTPAAGVQANDAAVADDADTSVGVALPGVLVDWGILLDFGIIDDFGICDDFGIFDDLGVFDDFCDDLAMRLRPCGAASIESRVRKRASNWISFIMDEE